ncbi:DNA oxidative demethylase ALKBH2-like [Engraulis encrasicolus]|uniref:DNA oxidative demethylase ALKBH2-like n=1 Tax=Engraulis encrasicolus TaxID=184585 RepID=UPI002FD5D708
MDKFVTRSKRPARSPVKARLSKKARGEPEEEKKRLKTCCEDEEVAGLLDDEKERSGEKQQEKEEEEDDDDVEWESPEGFSAPIPWRKIEAEGLDCDYGLLFKKAKATELFHKLEREVEYFTGEQTKVQVFGKSYSVPRKQATYGDEGLMYSFSGVHLLARPWTPTLEGIRDAVTTATGHTFNFVLINR